MRTLSIRACWEAPEKHSSLAWVGMSPPPVPVPFGYSVRIPATSRRVQASSCFLPLLVGCLLSLGSASAAPPTNDDFSNRLPLEGEDILIESSLKDSTLERDSSGYIEITGGALANECFSYSNDSKWGSVWWTWRAPRTGAAFLLPDKPRDPSLNCSPTVTIWDSSQVLPGFPFQSTYWDQIAEFNTGYFHPRYPYSVFLVEAGRTYYVRMIGPVSLHYSVRLRMIDSPFIVEDPPDRTLIPGEFSFLSVVASGVWTKWPPSKSQLNYEWQQNGVALPGEVYPLLLLSNVSRHTAGEYRVVVSDKQGVVTSRIAQVTVATELTAPRLSLSGSDAPSAIRYTLWGDPGRLYRFESSSNLVDWVFQPVQGLSVSLEEINMVGVYPPPPYSHVLLRGHRFDFLVSASHGAFFLRAQRADPRCNPCATRLWIIQFAMEAMLRENVYYGAMEDVLDMDLGDYLPRNISYLGNPAQDQSCLSLVHGTMLQPPSWGCLPPDPESLRYDDLINPQGVWNGSR